jgi:DNA-binding response OmpR family regulator
MALRRILAIEDDRDVARLLQIHLADHGFALDVAFDGPAGLARAASTSPDLVILDLTLPGIDGLELCRLLRRIDPCLPILMLTSRATELDRVVGLETGADDYLTKPFGVGELVARVKALFRRVDVMRSGADAGPGIRAGDVDIDLEKRTVIVRGRAVPLTAREFDLLAHFARHPGRVYTRAELLEHVWGYGHDGYEHTVNSHINRLRGKIEADPARPRYLVTVWGVGYKFAEPTAPGL